MKSDIKKDFDLLLKFLHKSQGLLPDFVWECRRPESNFKDTYKHAWKLNRYGDEIWEKLSPEGKARWFYIINKPYKKYLKKSKGEKQWRK